MFENDGRQYSPSRHFDTPMMKGRKLTTVKEATRDFAHSYTADFARRANLSRPADLPRRANHWPKLARLAPDQEGRIAIVIAAGSPSHLTGFVFCSLCISIF